MLRRGGKSVGIVSECDLGSDMAVPGVIIFPKYLLSLVEKEGRRRLPGSISILGRWGEGPQGQSGWCSQPVEGPSLRGELHSKMDEVPGGLAGVTRSALRQCAEPPDDRDSGQATEQGLLLAPQYLVHLLSQYQNSPRATRWFRKRIPGPNFPFSCHDHMTMWPCDQVLANGMAGKYHVGHVIRGRKLEFLPSPCSSFPSCCLRCHRSWWGDRRKGELQNKVPLLFWQVDSVVNHIMP